MIHEHDIIGSDRFFKVLNNRRPVSSCFTKTGNFSPIFNTAQMELTKFLNIGIVYTKAKKFL